MKINTSSFFSSLKYSAILSPVLTLLLLDIGLSPICPYTIAILSSKLEFFISSYNSLPSRLLSPAPTNTALALELAYILWINSLISTVLPTPAPPSNPILNPFCSGAKKSITLIPVHNGSVSTFTSFKDTALLFADTFLSLSNGKPSIGLPYESNILPNILSEYSTSSSSAFFKTILPFCSPLVEYKLTQVADILFTSTTSNKYFSSVSPSTLRISPIFILVLDKIISIDISLIFIILPTCIIFTFF